MQRSIGGIAASDDIDAPTGPARLAGLDGLRAVAVIAVFFYHCETPWARGGFLGVDLFFVISGFLITHLLAAEFDATSTVSLGRFYWRRAKRLLPASWLMTASTIIAAWLLAPEALPRLKDDALASLFYVTNWELLSAKASYFETIGRQPLLLHLWSLAIEEQFYIVWAPLLLLGLRRVGRPKLALYAALLGAALVAWTAFLATRGGYLVDVTPTRLDFGTDTHSFPLLIGAVLGLLWRPDLQPSSAKAFVSDGVFTLGLLALGLSVALFARLGEETPQLYPWGFLVSALTSAALVAAASYRGSLFGRWLDQQPLRWIGQRSYGIYLWHWPIFMMTRPEDLHLCANLILVLRAVLTLSAAAVSYAWVETPIRSGLLERIWEGSRTRGRRLASAGAGALVAVTVAAMATPVVAVLRAPPGYAPPTAYFRRALASAVAASGLQSKPIMKPAPTRTVISAPPKLFTGQDVTAVGDSVLLGSLPAFNARLPGARVYARVGWQARDVLGQLEALARGGSLTPVVLIHLGTNGFVYEDQLRQILSLLEDRQRVIIVNAQVPRRWMAPNNDLIDRILPNYPNAVLVDWRRASEGQRAYFISDRFHLTPVGQRALVAEIMRAGYLTTTGSNTVAQSPDLDRVTLAQDRGRL
jgi:peptidoglycan/LPS O-acetylase OafA/YrhL